MAAGWHHCVFSARQLTSATYCTPRKNSGAIIGSSSASILPSTRSRQLSPQPTRVEEITPVGYNTFTVFHPPRHIIS